jgi:hypothetical protein
VVDGGQRTRKRTFCLDGSEVPTEATIDDTEKRSNILARTGGGWEEVGSRFLPGLGQGLEPECLKAGKEPPQEAEWEAECVKAGKEPPQEAEWEDLVTKASIIERAATLQSG